MSTIDLGMDFQMPKNQSSQIKVMGIGGGGSNAVNYMYENGIKGVDFVICNTDAQALEASTVPIKIQLGVNLTEGLGAGSNPDIGKKAAEESIDRITELLDANTKMLFLTAGMGGGTGTGAAPVIAEIAREKGILTVGVVTHPFSTEGGYRQQYAEEGSTELRKYVDTLLIINNDKLIEVYGDLTFTQAFGKANEVLNTATKGIAEVISQHLLVNIDLNDARKVLENSGTAVMGQAQAEGENRAIDAVLGALDSPLLNDNDITGAKQVLLKIVTGTGDDEIKMSELFKIKNKIQEAAGRNVNIIEGIGVDSDLGSAVSVTVVATGFEKKKRPKETTIIDLNEKDLSQKIEDSFLEEKHVKLENENIEFSQHTLDLDEEDIYPEEDINDNIDEVVISEENNSNSIKENKIVFELSNDGESDEQVINNFIEKNDKVVSSIPNEVENSNEHLSTLESVVENSENLKIESRERESRLRAISQQLRTPSGLTKLEDVPAYKRNNIELEDISNVNDTEISTFTLEDDGKNKPELNENNSFLHDNVD